MPADTTSRQFHKLIPIMSFFSATTPEFLQIMKNSLSFVIFASTFAVVFIQVVLATSLVNASKFAIFGNKLLLLLFIFCSFLNLFLLLKLLIENIFTLVVLVNILNNNFFSLFFLNCIGSNLYCVRLIKFIALFLLVSMFGSCTSWQFLKLIPIIYNFITTSPSLLQIVKDRFARVVVAGALLVLFVFIVLEASMTLTSFLALLAHQYCLYTISIKFPEYLRFIYIEGSINPIDMNKLIIKIILEGSIGVFHLIDVCLLSLIKLYNMSKASHEVVQDDEDDFQNFKGQKFESTCYQSCLQCCGTLSGCLRIWCPCVCCCCGSPIYQIQTAKVGVHQSFGRYLKILKPGFHLINPVSESVIEVDMKTSVFGMAPQQVITKDNVSMQIETVVYYRAINPYKLVYKLRNNTAQIRQFIKEISYSALRSVIGQNIFQELLQHRAKVASQLQEFVKEKVYPWGLYIQNIFIKDVILPPDVQKNLQSAAIQKRVSQATIISAKADVESAKLLKQTSQILNSGSAMQIRYLQAVQNITNRCGNKTIFMSLKGKE